MIINFDFVPFKSDTWGKKNTTGSFLQHLLCIGTTGAEIQSGSQPQ